MIQFVPSENRERASPQCGTVPKKKMYMCMNHSAREARDALTD